MPYLPGVFSLEPVKRETYISTLILVSLHEYLVERACEGAYKMCACAWVNLWDGLLSSRFSALLVDSLPAVFSLEPVKRETRQLQNPGYK